MDNIRLRGFENAIEATGSVRQMPAHIRLHSEPFYSHSLAKRAESRDGVYARIVPLIPLQTAHLRHQNLGAAHLHAVDYMRDLHSGCPNLSLTMYSLALYTRCING